MSNVFDLGEHRLCQAVDGLRKRQIPPAPRLAVEFPSDRVVRNQKQENGDGLPGPLAEAVHNRADSSPDEPASECIHLRAQHLAWDTAMQPARRAAGRVQTFRQFGSRARLGRAALGIAAVLFAGLGAWQLVGPLTVDSPLYAQVRAATRKVGTIHVVVEVAGPDGVLSKAGELWYARGVGFACVSSEFTRIDDGKFLWEYARGSRFGSRSQSQGPDWMLDQVLDVRGELQEHCRRFPEGDREIDKVSCRCYQVTPPPVPAEAALSQRGPEQEVFVYVSEDFLVRRMETHELSDGKWRVRSARAWEYDVVVGPETFRPAFGADVEIVDADEAFHRLTDLSTALCVVERFGLIYAVHRAEQFENGGVAFMSSVRGTAETLRKFPLQRRMLQPGLYFDEGPATHGRTSPLGHGYFDIELAQADHQGINVRWWIVVPRGRPAGALEVEPGKVVLDVGVVANGKYANHLKDAHGVRQAVRFSETIAAPRHEPPAALQAIVAGVHAELVMLRGTEFKRIDLGVHDVNGAPQGKIGNVKDTSAAEFAAAVAAHIQFWERFDIDFQIKKAMAPGADFNPETQAGSTVPGAYLGYYSAVDNDTLKRFGVERPDIRIISLRHTSITSAGLAHLKVLEQLQELDLAETAIDDAGLAHLQEIKSLRRVNVTGTRVTDAGIEKLKAAVPSLEINDVKQ